MFWLKLAEILDSKQSSERLFYLSLIWGGVVVAVSIVISLTVASIYSTLHPRAPLTMEQTKQKLLQTVEERCWKLSNYSGDYAKCMELSAKSVKEMVNNVNSSNR